MLHWRIENICNMEHFYVTFVLFHFNCHNNDDRLVMSAVFILALLVCLCSAVLRFLPALHSLSAGNIIPYLFCQANIELCDCLCDLKVFSHEYLKKLWLSCFRRSMYNCCCAPSLSLSLSLSLPDRNEVTKLKFEGKTFHVYANQREVRVWIVGNTCTF